jgi:hypothetical protein
MKKSLFIFLLLPIFCSAQSLRQEVIATVSIVYDVIESSSLIIKTSNYEQSKQLIEAGISPVIIGVYRFKEEGMMQPLLTVEETFFHSDRALVSKYSNEQNPKRLDYQTFWLSQIASHTYGPVYQDSEGLYFTKQTFFNLE